MSIVSEESRIYKIISGPFKGKNCVIFNPNIRDGMILIVLDDEGQKVELVNAGQLAQLELPGWESESSLITYGLDDWFARGKGSGSNLLRTLDISQPQVLKMGDVLATEEIVNLPHRRGFNSSCLVHLNLTGWVELAGRLPLALKGNMKYRLPAELKDGDRLVTGCAVVSKPVSDVNWTYVCLDNVSCQIEVPNCIPLALA
jgi:hypothetical protein